mgnify:CR=1 FL=1
MFGERWGDLKRALLRPVRHVALANPFHDAPREILPDSAWEVEELSGCFAIPKGLAFPRPETNAAGIKPYYLLDAASVVAGRALDAEPGDRVLDMCAAPGGKTLVIFFQMEGEGIVVANDRSSSRRKRLRNVIRSFVPEDLRRHVPVRHHDATKWGLHQKNAFDRVLVDAPCSGERHLLRDDGRLEEWTTARTENLAQRQYALLCAAVDVVRPGGRIVYSTCALSPTEDDAVLRRLLESREGRVELERPEIPFGEPTDYGHLILPDETSWGPMYVAALRGTN